MKTINWDLCPAATHFTHALDDSGAYCDVFWRVEDGGVAEAWSVMSTGLNRHLLPSITEHTRARMIPRPSNNGALMSAAPAWDGQGLPPAGTVCELRMVVAGGDWHRAEVKFASRNVVVWDWEGESQINGLCTAYVHAVQFRPIRTPEEIAEEERVAAVSALMFDAGVTGSAFADDPEALAWAEALYRAGYRKQVAP